ncbi:MAG: YjjG family noncanonical pyrimidine nucleotidase [Salinivirgaceae bacterium]
MQKNFSKKYKNIYFDLDRTLWDFETNSEKTLYHLVERYTPQLLSRFNEFLTIYYQINEELWLQYRDGKLKKEVLRIKRFSDAFTQMGLEHVAFCEQLADDYISESPLKTALFPHAIDVLEYLKSKGYRLFLLTNGFKEVQVVKIKHSGLEPFFEKMITSEEAGYQKPHAKIFEYALKTVNAKKTESLMVGDDLENDIYGAQSFGMDAVYFNPKGLPHKENPVFEIQSLVELTQLL